MIHPLRQGCWDGPPREIIHYLIALHVRLSRYFTRQAMPLTEFSSPCFAHKIFKGRFFALRAIWENNNTVFDITRGPTAWLFNRKLLPGP